MCLEDPYHCNSQWKLAVTMIVMGQYPSRDSTMTHGTVLWSMVHGPWSMVHGPWPMTHGTVPWSMVHGPWSMVHGPWPMTHGTVWWTMTRLMVHQSSVYCVLHCGL